jgi:hypothetical protein
MVVVADQALDQAGEGGRLLTFRTGLRRFLHWSGEQAAAAGLTPARHQLLLAIRGHPDPAGPTAGADPPASTRTPPRR